VRTGLALALVTLVASLALGAGLASSAPLGDGGSKDPAGDAHAKGLSKAQLAAMDVVAVRVTGADNVGVFVTVTFRGNFQQAMGRGALAHAAAALVLLPRPGKKLASAGLITSGAGKIGRLQRHTRATKVGAFRQGRKLTFFALGPGWSNIKSATVETVANTGAPGKRLAAVEDAPPYYGPRLWTKFLTLHPIDKTVQTADPSGLTCPELKKLLDSIDADLDDPFFSQNVDADVTKGLHAFRSTVKGLYDKCSPPPPPAVRALFAWNRFSSDEVAGTGHFTGPARQFTSVAIVLPDQFTITNHLCPTQLPNAVISGNRIDCGGGILNTGDTFNLNLQTSPVPPNGIGGQLFGASGDVSFGPFIITGP
jgi:hypothetical protein